MVGRDRVDQKRHGGQEQHRTTYQQKILLGFFEAVEFTFKLEAVTTSDQDIIVRETECQESNPDYPWIDTGKKPCPKIYFNPRHDYQEDNCFYRSDSSNAFSKVYARCPPVSGKPEKEGKTGEIEFFEKLKHKQKSRHSGIKTQAL
jgi:hypothetical protein